MIKANATVRLHPRGLELEGGEILPLVCGSMHYWRHDPRDWPACLDAMKAMGMKLVDTYVPWGVHEIAERVLDFGERDPRLDVSRFLGMVHERGMRVVIRPGPHINAELTYFGLPERVVWDRACQARTPRDNPVMLPMVPVGFPVPSYASEALHDEVETWLTACGKVLAPHVWPKGPIVLLQIDNEGAMYFRDGPYDQDYHPDAVALFRQFLRGKYKRPAALRAAYGLTDETSFQTVAPPERFDAARIDEVTRHLDWIEFHEHLLATAMERFAASLADAGLTGIPTMHNFPLGEAATPLNAARMSGSIDLVALDYYHRTAPNEHMIILRRTSELAERTLGEKAPAFGAEVGAGFPPFFAPLDEKDSLYALTCALAYGLRGFNLYMAVERDRWVGAPIDPIGRPRKMADSYKSLVDALDKVDFYGLKRRAPVRLLVPRSLRRLARATHAMGPLTPALFNVLGAGFEVSCFEESLDEQMPRSPAIAGEAWIRAFERALFARGVPFAYAGGESLEASTAHAKWIVCVTAAGLKREVFRGLRKAANEGVSVTFGPVIPSRDGSMRPMDRAHDITGLEFEPMTEVAMADTLVARRIEELSLPTYPVTPSDAHVAVHEDSNGKPRVVFVMNPSPIALAAKFALPGVQELAEVWPNASAPTLKKKEGSFEVEMRKRRVRIFEVRG